MTKPMSAVRFGMIPVAVSVLALASGCASFGQSQRADTVGKGNTEVGVEVGAWGAVASSGAAAVPHLDAAVRYGVTDRFDIGLRGGFSFLEAQTKFLFTDPRDQTLAVSIAPSLGGLVVGSAGSSAGLLNLAIPVLVGIKMKGGSEFVIGPRLQNYILFGGGGGGSAAALVSAPGLSLGYLAQISESFGLMPELSFVLPVFSSAGATGVQSISQFAGPGGALFTVKLGFLFGRTRASTPPPPELTPPPPPVPAPPPPAVMPPPTM